MIRFDVFVNQLIGGIIRADSLMQLIKEKRQENGEQNGVYKFACH